MTAVVGRHDELGRIERFLSEAQNGYAALVLEGDAGIGKTTVWREGLRLAERRGFRALSARPAQAEAKLGFASLADLLAPVEDDVLDRLPEPQSYALEVALLKTAPGRVGVDARAVGAGLLGVVSRLAEQGPLLVAIDDVQWLDRPSAAALSFALRRLASTKSVGVLAALRIEPGAAGEVVPFGQLPVGHRDRLRLGPLTLSTLYHVIHAELGLVFPRPTLQRIEEGSGGNPFFALELARALNEAGGRPGPGEPLPVPKGLTKLLEARVAKLPARSREILLGVALLPAPSVHRVERVFGSEAERALEGAVQAGLIDVREDSIRFAHPLIGAAVGASVLPARRREMHRRLAAATENEEERARHIALGCDGPSQEAAATLERAARLADRRGAPQEAAELLELACDLTPSGDAEALARRRLELVRAFQRAGDEREAIRLLDDLLREEVAGNVRAQALELRAQVHWVSGTAKDAEACCEEALSLGGDEEALRARLLVTLARVTLDSELAHRRARAALTYLETLADPDPSLLIEALAALAAAQWALGRGLPEDVVDRALELERVAAPAQVSDRMSAALGVWLKRDGDFEGARHWLETSRRAAIEEGDEGSLPYILGHMPQLELWSGNWQLAEELALEHLELAERTGQSLERLTAIYNLSLVQAHMGRVEQARAQAEQALLEAEGGEPWNVYQLLSVLGFVELSLGRHAEAVPPLGRAFRIHEESGVQDTPTVYEDYAEALVFAGELDAAERVVNSYEQRARRAKREIALASALRCRGLLLAARQDLDAALGALEEALSRYENIAMPFSLGRTLLALGQVRRRRGERRMAKDALERAVAVFHELGAPLWAERAEAEIRRVPIRRSARTDGLTPTEARIAELVAQGQSNREVAQALFLSEKTVESNLTRVYRKLGIRSRSALAALMAEQRAGDAAPKP